MKASRHHIMARQGLLLFASTLLVNLGNYGTNLVLGRWLGPEEFSEVGLLITLLLMVSFVAMAFQLTATKYMASLHQEATQHQAWSIARWLRRMATWTGIALAVLFVVLSYAGQTFFNTSSPWLFPLFGLGMPLYLMMSVNRGILQGQERYVRLAMTYQAEMWVRLVMSIMAVQIGWGVPGVAGAITLSLLLALAVSAKAFPRLPAGPGPMWPVLKFLVFIMLYECSQILINNSDTLLVKHFFDPTSAGLYAALALIGRIVYFGTWTVVTLLFPTVIKLEKEGKPHTGYFLAGLGLVALIAVVIIAVAYLYPEWLIGLLFGPAYLPIAPLLWRYAVATALFACANVFVYYNISLERRLPVWVMIGGGLLQIILIWFIHDSFLQIIQIQILLMLLVMVVMVVLQWLYARPRQLS